MAFSTKVVKGECREFVVIPPDGAQFDELGLQARIAEALREAFPDAGFTVISAEYRNDDFTILPVLEERNGVMTTRMPHADVIAEIDTFLTLNFATIRAPRLH